MFLLMIVPNLIWADAFMNLNVSKRCTVDNRYCFPYVIWSYWDKEEISEEVQEMVESAKKNSLKRFTFCFLTGNNITNFLDFSLFPREFFFLKFKPNKADYIRISLLEKYGGVWVDASTHINSGEELEWFVSEAFKNQSQFVAFKYNHDNHDLHFGFLGAPENSVLMKQFKKTYDIALTTGPLTYVNQTCEKLRAQNVNLTCWVYFMIDMVFADITLDSPALNDTVLRLPENRSHMRLFAECEYDRYCFAFRYVHDPTVKEHAFVKVCRVFRVAIKKQIMQDKIYGEPFPFGGFGKKRKVRKRRKNTSLLDT